MKLCNFLFFLFALFTTLLFDNVVGALEGEGIIGGEDVDLGDYSYQVSLQVKGRGICGGGIIDATHIVTAAHCVTDFEGNFRNIPMRVVSGITDLHSWAPTWYSSSVEKVYIPREYNPKDYSESIIGDIAVLKVFPALNLLSNPNLSVLKLAEKKSYAGEKAIISGFGWNWVNVVKNPETGANEEQGGGGYGKMRFAESEVLTAEECQKGYRTKITDSYICAQVVQRSSKPEGVCSGDSGGPLVHGGDTLIGVVSTSPLGCKENVVAALYTRVSSYLDFIDKAVKDIRDADIRTNRL